MVCRCDFDHDDGSACYTAWMAGVVYARTAATAAHEKVVAEKDALLREARVCPRWNEWPHYLPTFVERGNTKQTDCPDCHGRGVTFGGGK